MRNNDNNDNNDCISLSFLQLKLLQLAMRGPLLFMEGCHPFPMTVSKNSNDNDNNNARLLLFDDFFCLVLLPTHIKENTLLYSYVRHHIALHGKSTKIGFYDVSISHSS